MINCRRHDVAMPGIVIFFMIFMVLFIGEYGIAQYGSYFTHVPSEVAGHTGIALWIKSPIESRYDEGAPVAIYFPGGFKGEGIGDKEAGLFEKGFIEISFNFQGNGVGDKQSGGGPYDHRGFASLRAARDVIRFALGMAADIRGKTLSDIVHPMVPLHTNVGLIGYSFGGSTNICIAGVHGHEIGGLA